MSDERITKVEDLTDEEIVRFLAVECMGWTVRSSGLVWDEQDKRGLFLLGGPLHKARIKMNLECPDEGGWNPLTSGDDMLMVIEAMREKDWGPQMFVNNNDQWICIFRETVSNWREFYQTGDDIKQCVCLAAIKALKEKE